MHRNERGSITLIQASIVLLLGASVLVLFYPFRSSLDHAEEGQKCLAEHQAKRIDLADPGLEGRELCK